MPSCLIKTHIPTFAFRYSTTLTFPTEGVPVPVRDQGSFDTFFFFFLIHPFIQAYNSAGFAIWPDICLHLEMVLGKQTNFGCEGNKGGRWKTLKRPEDPAEM